MSQDFEPGGKPAHDRLVWILFGVVLIFAVVGFALMGKKLNEANAHASALQEKIVAAVASAEKMNASFKDYAQSSDVRLDSVSKAIQQHDDVVKAIGQTADKIAERLNLVDEGVEGVQKDVKGHGNQLWRLRKKFTNLDEKFGEIAEELKVESEKNKVELGQVLSKIEDARVDLMLLKADVKLVKDAVEFVPTED
jgi:chromosome segregation ATPase